MRILKGYSKAEQKELEDAKKDMYCNDLINSVTSDLKNSECDSIKDKYDEADTDERISIIRDILDFYTGNAKFLEQKYYVHLIKDDWYSYLNITPAGAVVLSSRLEDNGLKTKYTHEEIVAMNPQLLLFEEEVEK